MKRIVTSSPDYIVSRNIVAYPPEGYTYVRRRDCFDLLSALAGRGLGIRSKRLKYTHRDFGLYRADLHHLFGTISLDSQPWVVSHSGILPDWGNASPRAIRRGIERLAGSHCKKIIALSESTVRSEESLVRRFAPDLMGEIMKKTVIIHPPQRVFCESSANVLDPQLQATFIGTNFFRKGGAELLLAMDRLCKMGANIRLHLVTQIRQEPGSRVPEALFDECQRILRTRSDKIISYGKLPNTTVLAILRRSHLALLPTYVDRYGYTVLEAQASATPVITTNIRALKEINNLGCGWVIQIPTDEIGNCIYSAARAPDDVRETIVSGIVSAMEEAFNDRQLLAEKGQGSLARIKAFHCPEVHVYRLRKIYDEALGLSPEPLRTSQTSAGPERALKLND